MDGNNDFFENFQRNKYLKKLPSMQRVNDNLGLHYLEKISLFSYERHFIVFVWERNLNVCCFQQIMLYTIHVYSY